MGDLCCAATPGELAALTPTLRYARQSWIDSSLTEYPFLLHTASSPIGRPLRLSITCPAPYARCSCRGHAEEEGVPQSPMQRCASPGIENGIERRLSLLLGRGRNHGGSLLVPNRELKGAHAVQVDDIGD